MVHLNAPNKTILLQYRFANAQIVSMKHLKGNSVVKTAKVFNQINDYIYWIDLQSKNVLKTFFPSCTKTRPRLKSEKSNARHLRAYITK